MNAITRPRGTRANWTTLALLGAVLFAFPAAAQAQEQPIGTVVGVPQWELDAFVRANAAPGVDRFGRSLPANNVTILHVAPEFNSAIATVSVTRRDNGQPAKMVYFPTFGNRNGSGDNDYVRSRIYSQINAFDTSWSHSQVFGTDHNAVLGIEISQDYPGTWEPGRTRFLMVPWEALPEILSENPSVKMTLVHRQVAHIGGGDHVVQLLAVQPNGRLASAAATARIPNQVPGVSLVGQILRLNPQVKVTGTDATGITPVTTIEVQ